MKEQLTSRLKDLKAEYQKGEERLAALEQETGNVKASMLRISGAVQVLEEILNKEISTTDNEEVEVIENGIKK